MQPVLELDNVTKMYGQARGIENVTFKVQPGSIFGFLGPNGAGKSTTINMLVDLLRPTSGQIKIFGLDSVKDSLAIRQRIGFLAGDMAMDRALTGWQQLEYLGNMRGNFDKQYVTELAKRLDCKLDRKFKTLSRGNKQKVGLIAALMNKPDLLILDEPTSGLDPLIQAEFNEIVLEHKKAGKTVFISSHVLSEVQLICDTVAFVRDGMLIAESTIDELSAGLPKEVIIFSNDKKLVTDLKKLKGFHIKNLKANSIESLYAGDVNALVAILARHKVDNLHIHDADLESVFMKFYGDGNA